MKWVIVVQTGILAKDCYGPFKTEKEAREWGLKNDGLISGVWEIFKLYTDIRI